MESVFYSKCNGNFDRFYISRGNMIQFFLKITMVSVKRVLTRCMRKSKDFSEVNWPEQH